MKGALPVWLMVTVVLVVIVGVTIGVFVFAQAGQQMSISQANVLFWDKCSQYKESGCSFSLASDSSFISACKTVFGGQENQYSCLRLRCECNKPDNTDCSRSANLCAAVRDMGGDTTQCCRDLQDSCAIEASGIC